MYGDRERERETDNRQMYNDSYCIENEMEYQDISYIFYINKNKTFRVHETYIGSAYKNKGTFGNQIGIELSMLYILLLKYRNENSYNISTKRHAGISI